MIIDLPIVSYEFNDCVQGNIQTIVENVYGKKYLYSQLYRWGYVNDEECINGGELEARLEKELNVLGLNWEEHSFSNINETIEHIKEEIKNGIPVITNIQIANCPWDPNFEKEFVMEHSIIVHGYDEEKEIFYCGDAVYRKSREPLAIKLFEIGGS